MRIVVKPAGLMLIIAMIGVLAVLAFVKTRPGSPSIAATGVVAPPRNSTTSNENLLKNPSFEGATTIPTPPGQVTKGKITGRIGEGWLENSAWATVSLDYAKDTNNPHDGKSSQRIKIVGLKDGQAQFVQEVKANVGKTYHAGLWVRASAENTPVEFVLREASEPYTQYKTITVPVGLQWQQVSLEGKVTRPGNLYLMIIYKTPAASLWLDDTTLNEID